MRTPAHSINGNATTGPDLAALVHHSPQGKEEMALQVLAPLDEQLEHALFESMRAGGTPKQTLDRMLDAIDHFYEGGKKARLLERLGASVDARRFRRPLGRAVSTWIEAVEALGAEAGVPRAIARLRTEDLVVRIEGALVLSAATGDARVFARTIRDLRDRVLAPVARP